MSRLDVVIAKPRPDPLDFDRGHLADDVGEKGTVADAEKARTDAAKKDKSEPKKTEPAKAKEPAKATAPVRPAALEAAGAARQPDVVFVPTPPPESVEALLALATPRPGETIVDLGCGDGRILVAAAQQYGCRGVGYDVDPQRIQDARARIAAAGLGDRVRVEQADLFSVDLSGADIVTLYLLPQLNGKLIPQLQALRPGARVVSHDFAVAGVIPDRVVQDYLPRLNLYKTYFLFTAPLRLQPTAVRHEWAESARLPWEASGAPAS